MYDAYLDVLIEFVVGGMRAEKEEEEEEEEEW